MNTKYLKAGALAFILLVLPSFTLAATAPTPSVSLNLLGGDIYVGDSFDVEVWADGDEIGLGLLTFGFDVTVADNIFSYDDYTIDPAKFIDLNNPDPLLPSVSGFAFPDIAANDVLLATLSFTAITSGTGELQTLGLTDYLFYGLQYTGSDIESWYDINASLNITVREGEHVVPIPATIFLFGSGLIGLIGFSHKSRSLV